MIGGGVVLVGCVFLVYVTSYLWGHPLSCVRTLVHELRVLRRRGIFFPSIQYYNDDAELLIAAFTSGNYVVGIFMSPYSVIYGLWNLQNQYVLMLHWKYNFRTSLVVHYLWYLLLLTLNMK